jgi:hypothetical protein
MRIEGIFMRRDAAHETAISMELAHLKPGPQDRRLFELPAGLLQLPSAALQAFLMGQQQ